MKNRRGWWWVAATVALVATLLAATIYVPRIATLVRIDQGLRELSELGVIVDRQASDKPVDPDFAGEVVAFVSFGEELRVPLALAIDGSLSAEEFESRFEARFSDAERLVDGAQVMPCRVPTEFGRYDTEGYGAARSLTFAFLDRAKWRIHQDQVEGAIADLRRAIRLTEMLACPTDDSVATYQAYARARAWRHTVDLGSKHPEARTELIDWIQGFEDIDVHAAWGTELAGWLVFHDTMREVGAQTANYVVREPDLPDWRGEQDYVPTTTQLHRIDQQRIEYVLDAVRATPDVPSLATFGIDALEREFEFDSSQASHKDVIVMAGYAVQESIDRHAALHQLGVEGTQDPWGNAFFLAEDQLWSAGPDGTRGTEDDVATLEM